LPVQKADRPAFGRTEKDLVANQGGKAPLNPQKKRAGKKEGGWGEGIFARPLFSRRAEFCISRSEIHRQKECCNFFSSLVDF